MKFSKKYLIVVLVFLFIALFLLTLHYEKRVSQADIDNSINKALIFLNGTYSKEYLFDDPYIKCTDQIPGCDTHYRKLDVATVLVFFLSEEAKSNPLVSTVVKDSEGLILNQLEEWKDVSLEQTPIDLYAVPVYYYPDETKDMLDELVDNLRSNGSWEDYDMYGPGYEWRKIADESWPIVALAKHKIEWDILKPALERKKYEGDMIMNGTWKWHKRGKYYGVLSIYHVFLWVKDEGYDMSHYSKFIEDMEDFLSQQPKDEYLSKWTVLTTDTLFWLCEGNYSNEEFLDELAKITIERQEDDGGWRVNTFKLGEKTPDGKIITKELYNSGRTHATLMSILALECDKFHNLMNS